MTQRPLGVLLLLASCSTPPGRSSEAAVGALNGACPPAGGAIVGLGGKCLSARGGASANGTPVEIADCDGSAGQKWSVANGQIVGAGGKCLDVTGANAANGTGVELWDCTGWPNQAWSVQGAAIVGLGGKCLDVTGSKTANGTPVEIWDCTGWDNQKWTLGGAPPPPPPPPSGVLPAKVLMTYYWPFDNGSPSIDDVRASAPQYNVLSYVSTMGDGSGSGKVILNGAPIANLAGQIAAWKASGRVALVMVSHIQGFHLTNATQVSEFVGSVSTLIDTYGFQGIDWDLEDSGSQTNQDAIVAATQALKSKYGASFVVSCVPRDYEVRVGGSMLWSSIMKAMLPSIDLISLQEYDSTVYADPNFAQISADYADAIKQGFPASKLMLGAATFSGTSVSGGAGSPDTYARAYSSLAAAYPGFRGAMVWQSGSDFHDAPSWSYATTLGKAIGK